MIYKSSDNFIFSLPWSATSTHPACKDCSIQKEHLRIEGVSVSSSLSAAQS
jgi:hypothetical protein